jgi:hypothetical protein
MDCRYIGGTIGGTDDWATMTSIRNLPGQGAATISDEWRRWIAENVLLNVDARAIFERLVANGFAPTLAQREIEEAQRHPYIASATALLRKQGMKRSWFVDTLARLSRESSTWGTIERRATIASDEFFDRYYARNVPLVLDRYVAEWPATRLWTLEYLESRLGDREVEVQANRDAEPSYEIKGQALKKIMSLRAYIDIVRSGASNDYYMTANNAERNAGILGALADDVRPLDGLLERPPAGALPGMLWLGPAGTLTHLHHDLTNNLMIQIVGRKVVKLISPLDTAKVYNHKHVYSAIADLDAPIDAAAYPLFKDATVFTVTLDPGDVLFIPIGWWHHVRSLDVSITLTCTAFLRANDYHVDFPRD